MCFGVKCASYVRLEEFSDTVGDNWAMRECEPIAMAVPPAAVSGMATATGVMCKPGNLSRGGHRPCWDCP